ncbi:YheT family hydrolase [Candidatus Neptunochlamydia vexilliferae]|uniref:AB hydrolase-1 domain-containing protein n=1 Tax=Candidatus Neptunichlamydia vexilliferae TaxID=1651774 RepID=A0ABS0AYL8_9BACT|nr:alpha/beta fold hydrolase [Candidatus Neptunochlamydia vexilliferae]MBF5059216.1 hypothetical protein [Candidatus Neptunochlamydia vexilliferae]
MGKQPSFRPFPLFTGRHAQTITASFLPFTRRLPSITRFVHLPDGERIAMEVSTPKGWKESDPTVVMIHGLCGCHRSSYLVRMTRKLYRQGIRAIRVNLRGCGSGKEYGKKLYHADASEDMYLTLKEIQRDAPHSPVTVVGFSLGGNIILKMAGEYEEKIESLVTKIIAVNPPLDLGSSIAHLSKNRFYERYFMSALREEVTFRHETFEALPPIRISPEMTLLEFDELYIAPQSGQENAAEYYQACSSGRLIHKITVPCHLLFARDDPIVDCHVLEGIDLPEQIEVLITEKGGHLGYLGMPGKEGGFHWMDGLLLRWISQH